MRNNNVSVVDFPLRIPKPWQPESEAPASTGIELCKGVLIDSTRQIYMGCASTLVSTRLNMRAVGSVE